MSRPHHALWSRLRFLAGLALIGSVVGVVGCVSYVMPAADVKAERAAAAPAVLAADQAMPAATTRAEWETRTPILRAAFEKHVYGRMPPPVTPTLEARAPITSVLAKRGAVVEQWTVGLGDLGRFNMIVITQSGDARPRPLIVMQNFCGNRPAFPDRPQGVALTLTPVMTECNRRYAEPLIEGVFGRHINEPPVGEILARGYALAFFYAGDVVADVETAALAQLARFAGDAPEPERPGALAIWAWLYSRAIDVLANDARIDPARIAVWGHSRNGKSALLAAAFDPRIAAVLAHQSGKGGATLTRSGDGETVAQITKGYPHWFAKAYAGYAGREADIPVDQHQLLALIAPRPVFLGNALRDKWSDPPAAWRAARGASPVYELYDVKGLDQPDVRTMNPGAGIAYFMRDGLHGVTSADWRAFLAFLDAHVGPPAQQPAR